MKAHERRLVTKDSIIMPNRVDIWLTGDAYNVYFLLGKL